MARTRRLASALVCFLSLVGLAACGGTNASGFDSGAGDDGGHRDGGGGRDATTHDKDSGMIKLLPDSAQADARCTGIACDVASCPGGSETTVTGYTYAPNGTLPLYDVQVYIPNAPLLPLPQGVQCVNCGTPLTGEPIATALSDPTGAFKLVGVPTGTDIPIVVQLGKWRRQTTIPKVTACTTTVLTDPNMTRLPKNQMEGNMPHIALTTGGCDQMGCMLPKVGIDPMEFGSQADGYNKAVNVYNGSGGQAGLGATQAINIWNDATVIDTYDEAIFSCECSESLGSKGGSGLGGAPFKVVTDYLNAGGRIFTTDFQYTWYKYSPDPNIGETSSGSPITGIGDIAGGAPVPSGEPPMVLSTTLPKAEALAQWLKYVFSGVPLPSGTTFPLDGPSQMGEIQPDVIFCNVQTVNPAETVLYASSAQTGGGCSGSSPGPRIFTVDTPVENPVAMQCGRGIHIDAHVDNDGQTVGAGYPTTGCTNTLKADEAAFAFFFFDLSSCISDEHQPPMPPPPVK